MQMPSVGNGSEAGPSTPTGTLSHATSLSISSSSASLNTASPFAAESSLSPSNTSSPFEFPQFKELIDALEVPASNFFRPTETSVDIPPGTPVTKISTAPGTPTAYDEQYEQSRWERHLHWLRDGDEAEARMLIKTFFEHETQMPIPIIHKEQFMENFYNHPPLLM
jgi:hypothetical protein